MPPALRQSRPVSRLKPVCRGKCGRFLRGPAHRIQFTNCLEILEIDYCKDTTSSQFPSILIIRKLLNYLPPHKKPQKPSGDPDGFCGYVSFEKHWHLIFLRCRSFSSRSFSSYTMHNPHRICRHYRHRTHRSTCPTSDPGWICGEQKQMQRQLQPQE